MSKWTQNILASLVVAGVIGLAGQSIAQGQALAAADARYAAILQRLEKIEQKIDALQRP